MNLTITRAFISLIFVLLLLINPTLAQPVDTLTVREVYTRLPEILGDTIRVTGYFHSGEYWVLAHNKETFHNKIQSPPHDILHLRGIIPEAKYSDVEVEGVVDTLTRPHSQWGVSYLARLTITSFQVKQSYPEPVSNLPQVLSNQFKPLTQNKVMDDFFALLVCGGDSTPEFWFDMVAFWDFAQDSLGIDSTNIYAFYYDGISRNEGRIPSVNLLPATKNNIKAAFENLKAKIQHCHDNDKIANLFILVTDYGAGYHTGSADQEKGFQQQSYGWCGGFKDAETNDENDSIPESELTYNANLLGPARGADPYYRALYGDGAENDIKIINDPTEGLVFCVYDYSGEEWKEAGRDLNGDGIINQDDGGIDLNLDGQTTDLVNWDEHLSLAFQGETITDDEWAKWQRELSDSSLVNIYEMIDCCFSGGFLRDQEREIHEYIAIEKAMACEEGEFSYFSSEFGGSNFGRFFMHFLDTNANWNNAYWLIQQYATLEQTPTWWSKKSVHIDEFIKHNVKNFALAQNYPNPFNASTIINFDLACTCHVELVIYNIKGEIVRKLLNETKPKGRYSTKWNGTDNQQRGVSSGIYFCQLKAADGFKETRKMFLLK